MFNKMKKCTNCKLEKNKKDFCKDKRHSDGLQSHCRECQSIRSKKWREKNKDYVKNKKNSEDCRKKNREWMRKDRIKNPLRYLSNNCKECGSPCDKRTDICFTCFAKGPKPWLDCDSIRERISETHKKRGIKPKTAGWNKGISPTEEVRDKIRASVLRGENHPSWKGGITPLVMSVRKCYKYIEWRKSVFARDDFTCQDCGARSKRGASVHIEAHHIKEFSKIFNNHNIKKYKQAIDCKELWDINNGITLCLDCHNKTKQGYWAWKNCYLGNK